MFSTNPSEYEEITITAPSHNLSESKRKSPNLSCILRFNLALADHTYCAPLCIPALPYHDCCKLEPEELYVDVIDHEFMEEVVIGPTEFYSPKIEDEGLDQEITEPPIDGDQVFDSVEHSNDDPKLNLQCKVEIPDIRETLYCYDCGEWRLTEGDLLCHKNDLLCHKINHSESSINGEQILENEQISTKEKHLLPCKVEIPDIRDELYCYKCGKWSLTADALLCHKIKMHRFFYEFDERVFEHFQTPIQQIHFNRNGNKIKSTAISKGLNKIFDENVFDKFIEENQHVNPHDDVDESQQENQIDKQIKVTAKAKEKQQNGKGVHKKRMKGLKVRGSNSDQIFPCDLCDKSFTKKYTLRIHKLEHRIKPFSCEMCGSSFDNERACAIHILKHAGIQPNHTSEKLQIKREKGSQEENLSLVLNENFYYDADESIFEQLQAKNQQSNFPHNKEESQKEKLNNEQITKNKPCKKEPQDANQNDKNNFYYDVDESTFEQFQAENQQIHYYPHDDEFQEHQKKRFVCEYCRRHFSRKDNVREHIQYACCTKRKGTNKNRKVGLKEQGSNKIFTCLLCDKSFTRKRTLRIHKRLHQIKPFSCEICGFLLNTERACAIHELKHATKKVEKQVCNVCGRVLNSKEELEKHKKSHAKSILRYICESCGTDFSRKSNLIMHIQRRCGTVPKKRKDKSKKRKIGERRFPCNLCNKSFTRQWCLDVHKHSHERRPFSCEICGQMFDNEKACEIHELLIHAGIKPHQCNQCEKAFECKSGLKIHMDKHRVDKPYSCDTCNRRFKYACNLKAHNKMFHNTSKDLEPQKFTCDKCGKHFTFKRYLIKHLRRHYQEWRYPCEHCLRPFRLASELESHILNKHTAFRPFECDRCTKRFATKHGLVNHERGHDGKNKKYPCDVCGKKFHSKKYQVVHTLHHQGIRNMKFSCETCGKEFEDHNSLKRHKIIHSDERPHSCDICGKSFKLKQGLRLHKIQIHTNIRPFVCEICGSRHKTLGDRTNHMKFHDDNEHWCDYCGKQFTSRNSVARHIFGYCEKSGQKRISKKFGKKIFV